jgi:hypothetical protein
MVKYEEDGELNHAYDCCLSACIYPVCLQTYEDCLSHDQPSPIHPALRCAAARSSD